MKIKSPRQTAIDCLNSSGDIGGSQTIGMSVTSIAAVIEKDREQILAQERERVRTVLRSYQDKWHEGTVEYDLAEEIAEALNIDLHPKTKPLGSDGSWTVYPPIVNGSWSTTPMEMTVSQTLDTFYREIDRLLRQQQFSQVDKILEEADHEYWVISILVGLLTITYPHKDDLTTRSRFYENVKRRLQKESLETDRITNILSGLQ